MPNYAADPQDADLQIFLTGMGFTNPAITTMNAGFVAAAVRRFERITGRIPFLAQASASYIFDPPGVGSQQAQNVWTGGNKIMELFPCFTSISAINMGVSPSNPNGTPLNLAEMVYLRPDNYAQMGMPIEWIEFLVPIYGTRQSLQVVGTPGNYAQWPADAWNAVLMMAAADLSIYVGPTLSNGLTMAKEDDVIEKYEPNPMAAFENSWRAASDRVAQAFKLIRMGLG